MFWCHFSRSYVIKPHCQFNNDDALVIRIVAAKTITLNCNCFYKSLYFL